MSIFSSYIMHIYYMIWTAHCIYARILVNMRTLMTKYELSLCLYLISSHCHFHQYFSFIVGGNLEYIEKTTNLSYVTDKLHCIMLYRVNPAMSRIQTHNFSDGMH